MREELRIDEAAGNRVDVKSRRGFLTKILENTYAKRQMTETVSESERKTDRGREVKV